MSKPQEGSVPQRLHGLLALSVNTLSRLRNDVNNRCRAGKKPHVESVIKADRAAYLCDQGRLAIETVSQMAVLLELATCPMQEHGCDGEQYMEPGSYGNEAPTQCQWCHERRQTLAAYTGAQP